MQIDKPTPGSDEAKILIALLRSRRRINEIEAELAQAMNENNRLASQFASAGASRNETGADNK